MPHDVNDQEIKPGDEIVVRYIVKSVTPGVEYCNCSAESVHGRRPDGYTESFSGNIGVCEKVEPTVKGAARIAEINGRPGAVQQL